MAAQYSDALCHDLADYCLDQALSWHQIHMKQSPCAMTLLSLTLLAKCLETCKTTRYHVTCTWKIADEIFRMIQDLGLYSETISIDDLYEDKDEQERVVRIFWVAFIYERILGITTGRTPAIDERNINIRRPEHLQMENENDRSQLKSFLELIDIGKIAGRIMRFSLGPAGLCAHSKKQCCPPATLGFARY
ncbi:hypothetical protein K492DRAFT_194515 [Lichtheimia hyalospora FSU 10163]|nr:hypothetical protein K492DRAFT_194515 [Lichtheimia hyalospora FSU 10163]